MSRLFLICVIKNFLNGIIYWKNISGVDICQVSKVIKRRRAGTWKSFHYVCKKLDIVLDYVQFLCNQDIIIKTTKNYCLFLLIFDIVCVLLLIHTDKKVKKSFHRIFWNNLYVLTFWVSFELMAELIVSMKETTKPAAKRNIRNPVRTMKSNLKHKHDHS